MKTILLVLYCISRLYASSQAAPEPALYSRLGSFDSGTHGSRFFINPARLAAARKFSAALYAEQRFRMAELAAYQLSAAIPVAAGSFGISGGWFGGGGYRQSEIGLAYARGLGARVNLGVGFHYARQQTAGYGPAGSGHFELGTLIRVTGPLVLSLHAVQPVPVVQKDQQRGGNAIYTLGLGYQPSAAVVVVAEMIRREGLPVSLHGALRYRFERRLHASIGIDTGSSNFYIGCGVGLGSMAVEAVTNFHPLLGPSPALILSFQRL